MREVDRYDSRVTNDMLDRDSVWGHQYDLLVVGGRYDTVFLLRPLTPAGEQWVDEKVDAVTYLGDAVAVEHRYIADIVAAAKDDGLEVKTVQPQEAT